MSQYCPAAAQPLLEIDGAGGRHGAAILRNHGQVSSAAIVRNVEFGLVVLGWMSGSIRDPGPKLRRVEL